MALVGLPAGGVALWSGPAAAMVVTTEAAFRAAWTAGGPIDLGANIALTCTNVPTPGNGLAASNTSTPILVNGHGFSLTQTCTTGNNNGVLAQTGSGAVTLENLTISGGSTAGRGGAISAGAPLTVLNATMTNNSAHVGGGAIASVAAVTITGSTVTSNSTAGDGGGIVDLTGTVTLLGSTVRHNTANAGAGGISGTAVLTGSTVTQNTGTPGGIFGSATLTGSTVSNNTGAGVDGAVVTLVNSTVVGNLVGVAGNSPQGSVTLVYTTVTGNSLNQVFVPGATFAAFGSVVALPAGGGTNCRFLAGTTVASHGFNLEDDPGAICGFSGATADLPPGTSPNLGPLADNGGPTATQLPTAGSPLVDAIPLASCQADGASGVTTDQRGLPRPSGLGCDVGAIEVQVPAPIVTVPRFTG